MKNLFLQSLVDKEKFRHMAITTVKPFIFDKQSQRHATKRLPRIFWGGHDELGLLLFTLKLSIMFKSFITIHSSNIVNGIYLYIKQFFTKKIL